MSHPLQDADDGEVALLNQHPNSQKYTSVNQVSWTCGAQINRANAFMAKKGLSHQVYNNTLNTLWHPTAANILCVMMMIKLHSQTLEVNKVYQRRQLIFSDMPSQESNAGPLR